VGLLGGFVVDLEFGRCPAWFVVCSAVGLLAFPCFVSGLL